jgi:hypothetical protein
MTLNDQAVGDALRSAIAHIRAGNLEQADAVLEDLGFERLLRPIKDRSKGPRRFFDPAENFGPERVHQTGDHIVKCRTALKRNDGQGALSSAESALARWERTER